jgi:hypothetical protein
MTIFLFDRSRNHDEKFTFSTTTQHEIPTILKDLFLLQVSSIHILKFYFPKLCYNFTLFHELERG